MNEMQCTKCGMPIELPDSVLGLSNVAEPPPSSRQRGPKCPGCGHVNRRPGPGVLGMLRGIESGLELAIGAGLGAILLGFILVFVVGPSILVYECVRRGDLVSAALMTALIGSYTVFGLRAAVRHELGPGAAFAALGVLAMIAWATKHWLP